MNEKDLVYPASVNEINPEYRSFLREHNSPTYPDIQGFSDGKGTENSVTTKVNEGKFAPNGAKDSFKIRENSKDSVVEAEDHGQPKFSLRGERKKSPAFKNWYEGDADKPDIR